MTAALIALYFIHLPARDLLALRPVASPLVAMANGRYLRWYSNGTTTVTHNGVPLTRLTAPAAVVADYDEDLTLRITIAPDVADNALFYGPRVTQVFVNSRKLNCRVEGDWRRAFYPVLNNREPCER